MRKVFITILLCLVGIGSGLTGARAQDYPTRSIRLVVPYLAGGGVDVAARIVGQRLSEALGQQVIIENRAGASGTIGAGSVAKAVPDGYTLLVAPGDILTMPSLMPQMSFDPHKELVPITMISSNPMLVVANSGAPFSNVKELLAAAQAKPGNIAYATPGNGTLNHVAGEWMAAAGKFKLLHVPYRGGAAAANGIAAGDVALGVVSPPAAQALIDAGRVKVIALTGKVRPSFVPASWPTLAENGLPVDAVFWIGLFAPAGTPGAIVSRLDAEMSKLLRDERVRKMMNDTGIEPELVGPLAFARRIAEETARYAGIIRETGIRIDR